MVRTNWMRTDLSNERAKKYGLEVLKKTHGILKNEIKKPPN